MSETPTPSAGSGAPGFRSVTVGRCSSGHRQYAVVWPDGTAETLHEGLWPNALNPAQRQQLRGARTSPIPPAERTTDE